MYFNHVDPHPKLTYRPILDELTDDEIDSDLDDLDSKQ